MTGKIVGQGRRSVYSDTWNQPIEHLRVNTRGHTITLMYVALLFSGKSLRSTEAFRVVVLVAKSVLCRAMSSLSLRLR